MYILLTSYQMRFLNLIFLLFEFFMQFRKNIERYSVDNKVFSKNIIYFVKKLIIFQNFQEIIRMLPSINLP
jgi:hypothetical protein